MRLIRLIAVSFASILVTINAMAAPSYNGDFQASNTTSMAFTVAAGTDQILIVRAMYESGLANPAAPVPTYNGVSMTLLRRDDVAGLASHIFYMLSPPSGVSYNIVIPAGGASRQRIEAFTYDDVSQTTPVGAQNAVTGTDSTAPFSSTIPFTPTSTSSTVVQMDWWQGTAGAGGYGVSHGNPRASQGFGMWQWHSSGFGDWNPPSTAAVSLTQSWTSGGTSYTSQAFELMASVPPTPTPLPTPTAGPIELTKTANVSLAMLGDTVTFCFEWSNGDNKSNYIMIWDSLPSGFTYSGCDTGCTESSGLVNWDLGMQGIGASGTVCTWGIVTGLP